MDASVNGGPVSFSKIVSQGMFLDNYAVPEASSMTEKVPEAHMNDATRLHPLVC
jgi:predicted RNA-binding protein with EMAP domain